MLYLPSIKQEKEFQLQQKRLRGVIEVKNKLLALFEEPSSIPNGETTKLFSIGTSGIHIQVTFFNLEENPFFAVTELFLCGTDSKFIYPNHHTLDIPCFEGNLPPQKNGFTIKNWPFRLPEERLRELNNMLDAVTVCDEEINLAELPETGIGRGNLTPPVFEV